MDQKKKTTSSYSRFSPEFVEEQDNFKWCIENDFKVFVQTTGYGESTCKIVVQRGGISTLGKDALMVNGRLIKSNFTESTTTYKTQKDAQKALPSIYKMLRERYG